MNNHLKEVAEVAHIQRYIRLKAVKVCEHCRKEIAFLLEDERFRVYVNAIQTSGLPEHKPKPERVAQIAAEHNFYREAGMSMEAMRPQAKKKSA
ncbi:MAG: hypothetical protein UY65_C0017G0002 [Parcubacteria group bacterium GW2011_GWA2_51_12]|nr:MAG: hypothetical protein UY65_C0017G0002 [Parcubacteria group bacterium GW2011_GWA2_51_12]